MEICAPWFEVFTRKAAKHVPREMEGESGATA
jgi:hypothetical protein